MAWPAELERLTLGHNFNRPLSGVSWPPRLQRLAVGAMFNQPVKEVAWPEGLEELVFGEMFDQARCRPIFLTIRFELEVFSNFRVLLWLVEQADWRTYRHCVCRL